MDIKNDYHSLEVRIEKGKYQLYGYKKIHPLESVEFKENEKHPLLHLIKEFSSYE